MKRQFWAVVACALVATACGATTTVERVDQAEPTAAPAPTAVSVLEPTAAPEPSTPEPPTPEPTAVPQPMFLLDTFGIGDCFDDAGTNGGEADTPTDPVDCASQHEYEIFFIGQTDDGPDEPYRFDTDFTDPLFVDFCDPATIEFGGAAWDLLPLSTTVWTPSEPDWNEGNRTFLCTAGAGLRDENPFKVGTAAGGTLVSDEGIVARSTIQGQRDLFFSFQASTLYPLTNGEFELPNLSPHVLSTGFLFASPLQDIEGTSSGSYDYNFNTGEITRLETGLEGWQEESPHFIGDLPAFVFAARETDADDWDLYLSRTGADPVALTDSPDDDHWPTLAPDGSQIVYHSGGDIWIMNVDGSDKQQLTTDPGGDFESAVSPDGTQIAFASDRSGDDEIWLMNIDGSDQQNLTNHPGADAWPFFSADGSLIYFQTDRLGVQSNIMMMEVDGSNQSYFSFEYMTNAALLPDDVSTRYAAELPSIREVLADTVQGIVPGAEGELTEVRHTSGRLIPTLPAGWEFEELDGDDPAAMLAAPSISAFNTTWAADGVAITLIEASSEADVIARVDSAVASTDSSCVLDEESSTVNEALLVTQRQFSCGEDNTAWVVGVFNTESVVGVLFEAQWDREPTNEVDAELFNDIAGMLIWGP